MLAWDELTSKLDELDVIRTQLGESRSLDRAARFYRLMQPFKHLYAHEDGDYRYAADVIELDIGWCIVHWLVDPRSVGLYTSILTLRLALCGHGEFLKLVQTSERTTGVANSPHGREALRPTEQRIMLLLGHGLSNKEIADRLGLSLSTIKNALGKSFRKLGVQDRTQASLIVRDLGLTSD